MKDSSMTLNEDLKIKKVTAEKINSAEVDLNVLLLHPDATCDYHEFENRKKIDENNLRIENELIVICAERNLRTAVSEVLRRRVNEGRKNVPNEALEAAVRQGHYEILEQFLHLGIEIENELILIAAKELGATCQSDSIQDARFECLKIILRQPGINVRCEDEYGNSPLHYAAWSKNSEAIQLLLRAGSYIGHKNHHGVLAMNGIPPQQISEHLDNCLQSRNGYEIEFDYTSLIPHSASRKLKDEFLERKPLSPEMEPLYYMADNSALKHLLEHPIVSSFLSLKWQQIRRVFTINLIFNIMFYLLLNCSVLVMDDRSKIYFESRAQNIDASQVTIDEPRNEFGTLWLLTATSLILIALRDILIFSSSPLSYLFGIENWLEVILLFLGTAVIFGAELQFRALIFILSTWQLFINMSQSPSMSIRFEIFKIKFLVYSRLFFIYMMMIVLVLPLISSLSKSTAENWCFVIFLLFFSAVIIVFIFVNRQANLAAEKIRTKSNLISSISQTRLVSLAERVALSGSHQNFFGFLSKRILLFSDFLPLNKLMINPYEQNQIRICGKVNKNENRRTLCMNMKIVDRAQEVLSRRDNIPEEEKLMNLMRESAWIREQFEVFRNDLWENLERFEKRLKYALENIKKNSD